MTKTNRNIASTFALLLIFMGVLMSCIGSTQPPVSQEQQLRATVVALQTQVALGQQPTQVTPTVSSPSSQEQQLQGTIAALQTQIARGHATAVDTPRLMPSPTPLHDTPPGTILEVGQTWRQGGAEVTLKNASLYTGRETGVLFEVYFTNRKPQDISISYSIDNFTAIDNRGRSLRLGYHSGSYYHSCDPQTRIVPAGQSIALSCAFETFLVEAAIGDTGLTEIIVTVSGISSINEARWRIPIYH